MIGEVLVFLRDHLNAYLNASSVLTPGGDTGEDKVVFVDGEKMDPITFKLGAVSTLLINVEEDNTLRLSDPFTVVSADGSHRKAKPEIRMNLYVLFVARFKQYEQGLRYLSQIIQHFQTHRVLNQHNAPEMSDRIEQLNMELITLPFSEQNEMWNALRTTYHPSVLYKVKMIVFRDVDAAVMPEIKEKDLRMSP
jgi:hypothetical protein